ncbi:hypothetical protein, partial [Escherichia coli]|uniref:hypothetical protein n=4 Tax=Escherichia coli TaxID=562 RepID=UPI0036DCD163
MDSGFVDLDILLTRIRHAQSKTYFLDAVKAYKAGALRGALTSAWVALVYDLIAKYRELSAMGDAAATAFLNTWDNATKSGVNRPGFPGECFICELRLPDHRFRWKHNK